LSFLFLVPSERTTRSSTDRRIHKHTRYISKHINAMLQKLVCLPTNCFASDFWRNAALKNYIWVYLNACGWQIRIIIQELVFHFRNRWPEEIFAFEIATIWAQAPTVRLDSFPWFSFFLFKNVLRHKSLINVHKVEIKICIHVKD